MPRPIVSIQRPYISDEKPLSSIELCIRHDDESAIIYIQGGTEIENVGNICRLRQDDVETEILNSELPLSSLGYQLCRLGLVRAFSRRYPATLDMQGTLFCSISSSRFVALVNISPSPPRTVRLAHRSHPWSRTHMMDKLTAIVDQFSHSMCTGRHMHEEICTAMIGPSQDRVQQARKSLAYISARNVLHRSGNR